MKPVVPLAIVMTAGLAVMPALASTKTFSLSGFDKVSASSHVRVILKQGPFSIQVSEPSGRFGDLRLEVRGSTLFAARKPQITWGWYVDRPDYTITVTAPAYSAIEASSHVSISGEVSAQTLTVTAADHSDISGTITARTLNLNARSHADIRSTVSADAVSIRAGDHSAVSLSGRCAAIDVTASSHADVDARALQCQSANIVASDHSSVGAFASRAADGRASSHADIAVYGSPPSLEQQASDHSSVRRL